MSNAMYLKTPLLGSAATALILALALSSCKNPLTQEVKSIGDVAASSKITVVVNNATSTAIANGVSSYDFGPVGLSDPPADVSFTMTNTGKVALAISSSSFGGTDAARFSYKNPPPASLAPSASAIFTIRFTPGTSGAKNATAVLATNDVSAKSFSFTLTGTGVDSAPMPTFTDTSTSTTYVNDSVLCIPNGLASIAINAGTGATIYYSVDGPTPTPGLSSSIKYTVPLSLSWTGTTKIRAIAVVAGMANSSMATMTLSTTAVSSPTMSIADRSFSPSDNLSSFSFSISTATANAKIAFTIDGTLPVVAGATLLTSPTAPPVSVYGTTYMMINGGSFIYAGAHTSGNFKLTAVAFVTSGSTITSPTTTVGNYSFQLSPPVWAGTQPLASYFATAQTITLSCVSGGVGTATMTYSTSTTGSAPSPVDVTGVSYSEPISVAVGDLGTSRSVTITAIAHETDWKDSAALSDIFHVCGPGKWDSSSWDQATWQ